MKRREVKSEGEKERYTHLNAEFQRIARRGKKAFLSDQCKEIEKNNRMGKSRDLFKKIRDTKETFHAKMGSIKDRNGMDLTEAEDNKKRWQEHTEELYKTDLHDPDNHDGVLTHLEPDVLECEVKGALGSITLVLAQVNKNNINKIQHPLNTRHILNVLHILNHFSLTMAAISFVSVLQIRKQWHWIVKYSAKGH